MASIPLCCVLNHAGIDDDGSGFRVSSNPFADELPWPPGAGACQRDTGYPPELILELWESYYGEIFRGDRGPSTGLHLTATENQKLFYLVFIFIHVSTQTAQNQLAASMN